MSGIACHRSRIGALALAAIVTLGLAPPRELDAASLTAQAPVTRDVFSLLIGSSADLGPVSPDTILSQLLVLRDPTTAREARDLTALYTPQSPTYGHYLTAAEVATRYGPAPADITRLRAVLTRLGLSANWHPGDDWLIVHGPAGRIETVFQVQAHWYRSPRGMRFYAASHDPVLPAVLRPYVIGVDRLSSYLDLSPASVPAGGLKPVDLLGAYDIKPLRDLGLDGTGQTVVFFELDGYVQSDLDTFSDKLGLPRMQPILKAGPSTLPLLGETEMDLEVVHEIAPGAKLLVYNFDLRSNNGRFDATTQQSMLDLQTRMVDENPGAVISQSWGFCEKLYSQYLAEATKNLYDHADALGETVFAITHDDAAYMCLTTAPRGTAPSPEYLGVPLPADAPGVTAVGGTRLSVSANRGWYNETVWEYPIMTGGTGGGVSAFYPRPSWQQGAGVVDAQFNPRNMRSMPDVAADADPMSGVAIYTNSGSGSAWTAGGGTSQSAPIWAGIAALTNQYLQTKGLHALGFLNPALYQIAAHPTPYPAFHDVTQGNNLYYPATPGYDMTTGLGTPDVWNLARDLEAYQRGAG